MVNTRRLSYNLASIALKLVRMRFAPLAIMVLLLALSPLSRAEVEVLGLFKGAALLQKDGEQKMLKVGEQWQGIVLLSASSREALAEINGERVTLTVSRHITTHFVRPPVQQVIIRKNANRQYITTASINGRGTRVLVDSGANIVAMNSHTARALGVDISKGTPSQVGTASGVVAAHSVVLQSVDVGGIKIQHVQASVIEGDFPEMVLLGVSYLQHVEMREKDGVLTLTAKY